MIDAVDDEPLAAVDLDAVDDYLESDDDTDDEG